MVNRINRCAQRPSSHWFQLPGCVQVVDMSIIGMNTIQSKSRLKDHKMHEFPERTIIGSRRSCKNEKSKSRDSDARFRRRSLPAVSGRRKSWLCSEDFKFEVRLSCTRPTSVRVTQLSESSLELDPLLVRSACQCACALDNGSSSLPVSSFLC